MKTNRGFLSIALASALIVVALPFARGGADDPEREETLAVGRQAFRDNCLMCHAEELTTRSRLTSKQWSTELDKMIGWGAPVPPELKAPLLDYLVSGFSDPVASPVPAPERISFRDAFALVRPEGVEIAVGDAARGGAPYATHCATCHGADARGADLGTCLVERGVLLRPTEFAEVVHKGRRRMPGFAAALNPQQQADILAWLRTKRFTMPLP